MILTLIWAGISAAWNLLAGFAGQFSLGHAAFLGIGAYAAAIGATHYGILPWGGMIAGALIAGSLALVIGSISLRMRGPFFTLLTIAFAEVVRLIAIYWKHLTNGSEGVIIELKPGLMNLHFLEKWPYLIIAGIYAIAMGGLCAAIRRSRIGHQLLAIRDDEDAARSLGVPAYRLRVAATVISAVCTAVHPVHRPGQHYVVPAVGRGRLDYHCRRTGASMGAAVRRDLDYSPRASFARHVWWSSIRTPRRDLRIGSDRYSFGDARRSSQRSAQAS
jgi:ribose/xylose/arabinose/galactoside ABC-type transport system permease subunit